MTKLSDAIIKTFKNEKHIAGYDWAKENKVNMKQAGTLTDSDYDKMEEAVNNNIIDMDVFNAINNGIYITISKYDK